MAKDLLGWYNLDSEQIYSSDFRWELPKEFKITGGTTNMAKVVNASEIGVGDVINVVHEGQVVSRVSKESGETLITTREGKTVWPTTNGNAPTRFELVKKAKPKPENWPPKYNDVWKATTEWVGSYYYHCDQGGSMRYGSFATKTTPDSLFDQYDKLELVYRAK